MDSIACNCDKNKESHSIMTACCIASDQVELIGEFYQFHTFKLNAVASQSMQTPWLRQHIFNVRRRSHLSNGYSKCGEIHVKGGRGMWRHPLGGGIDRNFETPANH